MSFTLTDVGDGMRAGTYADLEGLLDSLREADAEHPDVAIQTDNGMSLSVFANGLVVIEDVESDDVGPHWAIIPQRDVILELAAALDRDGPDQVMSRVSWQPGYGPQR